MNAEELRSVQAPLKEHYRAAPEAALITLQAQGRLGEGVSCKIETGKALVVAGLHPATGGSGQAAPRARIAGKRRLGSRSCAPCLLLTRSGLGIF